MVYLKPEGYAACRDLNSNGRPLARLQQKIPNEPIFPPNPGKIHPLTLPKTNPDSAPKGTLAAALAACATLLPQ